MGAITFAISLVSLLLAGASGALAAWLYLERTREKREWDAWTEQEHSNLRRMASELFTDRLKIFDERLNEAERHTKSTEGLLGRVRREMNQIGEGPREMRQGGAVLVRDEQTPAPAAFNAAPLPPPPPPPQFDMNGGVQMVAPVEEQPAKGIRKQRSWKQG